MEFKSALSQRNFHQGLYLRFSMGAPILASKLQTLQWLKKKRNTSAMSFSSAGQQMCSQTLWSHLSATLNYQRLIHLIFFSTLIQMLQVCVQELVEGITYYSKQQNNSKWRNWSRKFFIQA